jgi:penicillin-binding protein 1B
VGKAAWVDMRQGRKEQGASTLTMQLARSYFLDQEKTWRRKLAEVLITLELERRFTKQKILELYANEVYLGRKGSFSVHGFGQAARTYFNKEVKALTLDESALLVGMIQRPAYFNPFKYPERTKVRRDLVLTMMANNGYVDASRAAEAAAAPIRLIPAESESSDAPYFVDLVNNEIDETLGERASKQDGARLYTTLDMALQREAVGAVREAMQEVDRNARAERGKKYDGPMPQVVLVALDPHTGAVRALVGGRNYGDSQLNRALAKRQPGSSFKPFVYAAAINTAVQGSQTPITTAMHVLDEPTTFRYKDDVYEPGNFDKSFRGEVTLRQALMMSLNIPTVKVAEKTGYSKVVQLAKAAGMNENLHATPALALGAYEVTPIEIASAYTIFSNQGEHEKAFFIDSVRDPDNRIVFAHKDEGEEVLDPRVSYIITNMMEDVVRYGTGAGIRSRGFEPPAAGKTGTSRDGWFAGFTSTLLTVVWVGYDDNSELNLEGAKSALPVWVNFMKRAHKLPQYRGTKPFVEPKGISRVSIDPSTGGLARPDCPTVRTEIFIQGTEPDWTCDSDHQDDQEKPELSLDRSGIVTKVTAVPH